ncbi:innexin shaking-B-like isoform X2 [Agrilus planipennis]|uniref:Innexin n=1 Tax=Agrilus planipennis TaxID=224129 RepID=A0A1W4XQL8_AGRPL|nr:innexin shaking-B-like isoform X2 [Agrilus planipennis]
MRFLGRASSERLYRERHFSSRRSSSRRHSLRKIEEELSTGGPVAAPLRRTHSLPDLTFNSGMDILRGVYTLTTGNHITIDSLILRLHSNATVILLVTFSVAITTRQYVGNPIDCVHTRDIPEEVLNTYCWIHSTYTVLDAFKRNSLNNVAYPGVDNSYKKEEKSPTKQVRYYQWVAFMLFFQMYFAGYIQHTVLTMLSKKK